MDIKKVIKSKGWTINMLAAEMKNKDGSKGVTHATVSQMISGNPTLDKLKEIASIIGISVSDLVADESDQSRHEVICPHCGGIVEFSVQIEVTPKN